MREPSCNPPHPPPNDVPASPALTSAPPPQILDIASLSFLAGPKGLVPGDELTFFYPSSEWAMAQPFDCFCGAPTCRGRIDGAGNMTAKQLEGVWLNGYIREMLAEKEANGQAHAHAAQVNGVEGKKKIVRDRGVTSRELSGEMGGDTTA